MVEASEIEERVVGDEEELGREADGGGTGIEKQIQSTPILSVVKRRKEKVLVLSSRKIPYRFRHLMEDILRLLPHAKKDSKVESSSARSGGGRGTMLCEMADLRGCSSCVFFETKKRKDLFVWFAKTPLGPSVKFHAGSIHTMQELKLTGNHLRFSRPLLSFSPAFDQLPHLQLLKELFTQIFSTPKDHRKSKPFVDHVLSFSFLDNHVWFRNYQIQAVGDKVDNAALEKMSLVEVGPRFCLNPIRIFSGSFGGATLYENPFYVSPNAVRSAAAKKRSSKYVLKVKAKKRRMDHVGRFQLPDDQGGLDSVWREGVEDYEDDGE